MSARILIAVMLLLAACEDFTRAADPVWNKQPCSHCHMLVSDPRYAAQLVTKKHERLHFDDPGCLAAYMHDRPGDIERAWVRVDDAWVGIEEARFSPSDSSPMGYGLLADRAGQKDFSAVMSAASARRNPGAP